jgi:hypothetical protein
MKLTPGADVIKLFFFVADDESNKLECFTLEALSSQVL